MTRISLFVITILIGAGTVYAQPFGYTPLQIQSLFAEEFRNEQYEQALVYGRWLVDAHPKEMDDHPGEYRGDRNFRRMIDVYEHMANQQDDPGLREAYLDSSLQLYDRVLAIFDDEEINIYRWYFQRGRFYQSHADHIENGYQLALQDYETMFQMDPERATTAGNGYYVQMIIQNYVRQEDRDAVFSIINDAEPYADSGTIEFFAEIRNELITDPDERIELLSSDLEEDPENLDLLHELYELYRATGNRDKAREMAVNMYEINPNVSNILRLADKAENVGEYTLANRYLREAHSLQEDSDRARTSLRIAENHLNLRNLQDAREYARRAANEDPNWADPFITIAQIYGQAVTRCAGSEMTRIDKVVYWLVLDYLDRARERNSGVASTVNRMYRTYQPVTPTAEEKFYQNWSTGDRIHINGDLKECYSWIGEDTTIR